MTEIYVRATTLAQQNHQTIGPKKDLYITLEQLGELIMMYSALQAASNTKETN